MCEKYYRLLCTQTGPGTETQLFLLNDFIYLNFSSHICKMGVRMLTCGGMKFRKEAGTVPNAWMSCRGATDEGWCSTVRAWQENPGIYFMPCSCQCASPHLGKEQRGKGLLKSFHKISSFYKISSKTPEWEHALLSHCEGEGGARSCMKTEATLQ